MSDNKKYYYMRLKENFFDSEEMIILQNMPDGYLYSDILLKLYLRSLKNEGKLMFKNLIPYTPTALAQITRHQVGTVEKALKIFEQLELIEVLDNGAIYMMDIQNFIGQSSTEADRRREYDQRIRLEKEKIKQLEECRETSPEKCCEKSHTESHEKCTPEIETELKSDIYLESDTSTNVEVSTSHEPAHAASSPVPYKQIQDLFNEICVHYPKCQALSENRKKAIKARINSGMTIENFRTLFEKAEASTFLRGGNDRNWHASFDWLIKDTNMVKVLEGNYDNKGVNGFGRNYGSAVGIGDSAPDDQKISGGVRL